MYMYTYMSMSVSLSNVCICICICLCTCMWRCIRICICIRKCICICVCICMCMCICSCNCHIRVHVHAHVYYVNVSSGGCSCTTCIYGWMNAWMAVCMCVYVKHITMHTHTFVQSSLWLGWSRLLWLPQVKIFDHMGSAQAYLHTLLQMLCAVQVRRRGVPGRYHKKAEEPSFIASLLRSPGTPGWKKETAVHRLPLTHTHICVTIFLMISMIACCCSSSSSEEEGRCEESYQHYCSGCKQPWSPNSVRRRMPRTMHWRYASASAPGPSLIPPVLAVKFRV